MEHLPSTGSIVCKLVFLTLLGFGVVVLAPAIFAILSKLVLFALAGLLVWGGFELVFHGPEVAWQKARRMGLTLLRSVVKSCRSVWQTVRRMGLTLLRSVVKCHRSVWQTVRRMGLALQRSVVNALGGAVIGGFLGALGGMYYKDAHIRIPIGILLGALIGAVVGAMRMDSAQRPMLVEPAEKRNERHATSLG